MKTIEERLQALEEKAGLTSKLSENRLAGIYYTVIAVAIMMGIVGFMATHMIGIPIGILDIVVVGIVFTLITELRGK